MRKNGLDEDVYILAIESSCDETAAAVVKNGRQVLSNVISSQIALHTLYGGVVPEIASRKHIEKINQVVEAALEEAHMALEEMTAVAVTYGPGLVGALLVGVAEAKAIAYGAGKPLVGVHHIEGHVSANFIEHPDLEPPFVCLIVSGGHTHLVVVKDYGEFEILGRTRDDAAGEAFDKVARAVGLGYPGGPKVDKTAREGNPEAIRYPRAKVSSASAAALPFTEATPYPTPMGPFTFTIEVSSTSTSPGNTFCRNLALLIPAKYAVPPFLSGTDSMATAPV